MLLCYIFQLSRQRQDRQVFFLKKEKKKAFTYSTAKTPLVSVSLLFYVLSFKSPSKQCWVILTVKQFPYWLEKCGSGVHLSCYFSFRLTESNRPWQQHAHLLSGEHNENWTGLISQWRGLEEAGYLSSPEGGYTWNPSHGLGEKHDWRLPHILTGYQAPPKCMELPTWALQQQD